MGVTTIIVVYRHAGTRLPGASADWAWPVLLDFMWSLKTELVKVLFAKMNILRVTSKVILNKKTREWSSFSRERTVQIACCGVCLLLAHHYNRGTTTSSGSGGIIIWQGLKL